MPGISIHLFDLHSPSGQDFEALIDQIARTPKARRWRDLNGIELALLETRRDRQRGLILLDFVKRRYVGPGKVRADSELDSFEFQREETFGEETSAIYDVQRGWLVVQYNQHGVRAPSIAEYLNAYNHDAASDWQVEAKLDPTVEERVRRKSNVRSAQIKVRLSNQISAMMRDHGEGLGRALERAGREAQAATLSVDLSMSHDAGFLSQAVRSLARRLSAADEHDVKQVRLVAREGDAGQDEVIDLLRHRLKKRYSSDDLDVERGRYTLDSRWRALMRVHVGWVQELENA